MFEIGLTDHLEGPRDTPSAEIYNEVAHLVRLADDLGVRYAWFAEHHGHMHEGHLPAPLPFALHLTARTRQIYLGSAVICLNLHHPLDVAEQIAVADVLSGGRMAPGFGSGSTDEEYALFGVEVASEDKRHAQFETSLQMILGAWNGQQVMPAKGQSSLAGQRLLPIPPSDLAARSWLAVNSIGAARIAGRLGFNVLFSHLRTVAQYRDYFQAYCAAGGNRLIAANRPVFVGPDDATAIDQAETALRILWRRFRDEGKISRDTAEPTDVAKLCRHPINFIIGGPATVAAQLRDLHAQFSFDVLNVEVRWAGLQRDLVSQSLRLLMEQVMPHLQ
jgi:alkanesulfonate monooxygenase SsuD/methylene tetrahydromethanopterin reductase-like flavin-dependent oxidoreductase (luciferase family)